MKILKAAASVVELMARDGGLSPAAIAEETGIPRSTVYRLLGSLVNIDIARWGTTENHADLSTRVLHLGRAARTSLSEWRQSRPILSRLRDVTGQSAFVAIPYRDQCLCLDWAPGLGAGMLVLRPGGLLPLHASGLGRVVLAYSDVDPKAMPALAHAFTERTMTRPEELMKDAAKTRAQGFVLSDQDVTPGVAALAVPILSASGVFQGALSIGGLVDDIVPRQKEFVEHLIESAQELATSARAR